MSKPSKKNYPSSYILQTIELTHQIYRIRFENHVIAHSAQPGQFINIRISYNYTPLWRRPFSIHSINKDQGWVDILFRVVGKGTEILSHKKKGDSLNLIGPLGQSFIFSDVKMDTALVVA